VRRTDEALSRMAVWQSTMLDPGPVLRVDTEAD
jgi:hypothetical protein